MWARGALGAEAACALLLDASRCAKLGNPCASGDVGEIIAASEDALGLLAGTALMCNSGDGCGETARWGTANYISFHLASNNPATDRSTTADCLPCEWGSLAPSLASDLQ